MRIGIIGVGNMGSTYAAMLQKGEVQGLELAALTKVEDDATNLSGWERCMIELPSGDTEEEKIFEQRFEKKLNSLMGL